MCTRSIISPKRVVCRQFFAANFHPKKIKYKHITNYQPPLYSNYRLKFISHTIIMNYLRKFFFFVSVSVSIFFWDIVSDRYVLHRLVFVRLESTSTAFSIRIYSIAHGNWYDVRNIACSKS